MRLRSPWFEHRKAHVILHFLAHFSIENSPVKGYTSGSVDIFVLGAKGESSLARPRFKGRRRGRSLTRWRSHLRLIIDN